MKRYLVFIVAGLLVGVLFAPFMAPPAHGQTPDVATLLYVSADRHGVAPELLDRVVRCESTYRANVTGPDGSMGIAQFQAATWAWASAGAGWAGVSPYNAEAAIDTMAWLIARGGLGHWSACAW